MNNSYDQDLLLSSNRSLEIGGVKHTMLRVMSYCILSEEREKKMEFPHIQYSSSMLWDNRLNIILDKITLYSPDILCLQSVDLRYIADDFVEIFDNYSCLHHESCKLKKDMTEGCATFIRKGMLEFTDKFHILYYGIISDVKITGTDIVFKISNLSLREGLRPNERYYQMKSCMLKVCDDEESFGSIICGNFNQRITKKSDMHILIKDCEFELHRLGISMGFYDRNLIYDFDERDYIISKKCVLKISDLPPLMFLPNNDEPSDHYPVYFSIIIDKFHSHENVSFSK